MRRYLILFWAITGAFLACAAPRATVVLKEESVECAVDSLDPAETGAWIWFLVSGLPTGCPEPLAGLSGVDFKVEDGRLSRYVSGSHPPWSELGEVARLVKGGWQIVVLPRSAFPNPEASLQWRIAFFPGPDGKPQLYPVEGPGRINSADAIPCAPASAASLDLAFFLAPPPGLPAEFARLFAFRHPGALVSHALAVPALAFQPADPLSLCDPWPGSVFWPDTPAPLAARMAQDFAASQRMAVGPNPIVFPPLRGLRHDLKVALLEARLRAAHQRGSLAGFIAEEASDVPESADGAIFDWGLDDQHNVRVLEELRHRYSGPLWLLLPRAMLVAPSAGVLAHEALLHYRAQPLLACGLIPEELSARELSAFLWLRLHAQNPPREQKAEASFKPLPALESGLSLQSRLVSFGSHLAALEAVCRRAFFSNAPGG